MIQVCLFHKNSRLVPYSKDHDKKTVAWLNDPNTSHSFGLTRSITLEAHRFWLISQKDLIIWAILDEKNIHQGNISIKLNPRHASAYLQIYIGNVEARGKGLGWNSLLCILSYSFDFLKLNRIWLHTVPENIVAIRIYSKVGFVMEGLERESIFNNDGFQDQMRWSLLASDWAHKKKEVLS